MNVTDGVSGAWDQFGIGRSVARHLPEGAIVSDEAATSSLGPAIALATAAPHDVLSLTGGSIGQGMPLAAGAAVACPDRKVVCLHGDGGAMYTVQALWTQAREQLDVTTVIFANRSYAILNIELMRVGAEAGPGALSMLDIGNPTLDWVALAAGMGIEAVRTESLEAFDAAFAAAMRDWPASDRSGALTQTRRRASRDRQGARTRGRGDRPVAAVLPPNRCVHCGTTP